jgi:hypothetical protein
MDTTEIEKRSLEAHVDLCAVRYQFLEEKLESVEEKIITVAESIATVKAALDQMATKNNDRLVNWGVGLIVSLLGIVGYLVVHYVLK